MNLAKRHSWFFVAAGVSSWLAIVVPEVSHYLKTAPSGHYVPPGPLAITAFVIFGLGLAGAILDETSSARRRWFWLVVQVAAIMLMAVRADTVLLFPLLVLTAWQVGLVGQLPTALAGIVFQTLALRAILWPLWTSPECWTLFGIYLAFQFFAVFAARIVRAEASQGQMLSQVNAELRATRALLADAVRAEERVRISRELHDAWGHDLTALNLKLEYIGHLTEGAVRENLAEAKGISRSLLTRVRDVVGTLRVEEGCDIARMLQELVAGLSEPTVHLIVPPDIRVQSATQAQALLRCVQEIITNAVKHAGARNLWLELVRDAGDIRILARDDGHGAEAVRPGNGLTGMRERFEGLGGGLEIQTAIGRGFSIIGWLPASYAPR